MVKVFLIGNLTKDPELTTTANGVSYCKMTVAVKRKSSDTTDFLTVKAWRVLADNCSKYLGKGSKVAVCGELQSNSYETQSGEKRYVTEIVADEVQFLTGKQTEEKPQYLVKMEQEVSQDKLPFDTEKKYVQDDLPF